MGKDDKLEAGSKRPPHSGEDCEAPKQKKQKHRNTDPDVLALRKTVHVCCRNNDLQSAITAYNQAVSKGVRVEAQSFYNLLSLCDGLGEGRLHIGTPRPTLAPRDAAPTEISGECSVAAPDEAPTAAKEPSTMDDDAVDLATRQKYAEVFRKHMESLAIPLTETAYTALIKVNARTGNLDSAEHYMSEAEGVQQCKPKLRMYSPLLMTYCENGQIVNALKVWQRLSKRGLNLSEREYAALLRGATLAGDSTVMTRVLSDLSEDVLVPSRESVRAIIDWFESPHASKEAFEEKEDTTGAILQDIEIPYADDIVGSMASLACRHGNGWKIDSICDVDGTNGTLTTGSLQGFSLKPVKVSNSEWQRMQKMNETIVVSGKLENDSSAFQGGKKGPKKELGSRLLEQRQHHWAAFQAYLSDRTKERKFDVVIDGANVGFYEQNYAGAPKHVSYHQIDAVVQHFLKLNKSVLLVMHFRHFAPKMMPARFQPLLNSWLDLGILYRTPPGMNDDWFWLHAALSSGPGTLVLSNDEMRDHHFQMIKPRSFLKWKDRHLVRFSFGDWVQDGTRKKSRKVLLTHPEVYSRSIQRVEDGFVIPLPKRGDEQRFLDGVFTADNEEKKETYVCIRPKIDS